ncbi:MAG: hypothetical protein KME26_17480 [Oscillatoria princeps RMCB-10]|nr:hypothetical protein [Oscillatoria princeps RMCB-10]
MSLLQTMRTSGGDGVRSAAPSGRQRHPSPSSHLTPAERSPHRHRQTSRIAGCFVPVVLLCGNMVG